MILLSRTVVVALALLALPPLAQAQAVAVEGLMKDRAVLQIDGQRKLLRVGETFGSVTLVSVTGQGVVLDVAGERRELGLSRHIGSVFEQPTVQEVTIPRDSSMQYRTTALINGHSLPVLVDTGASMVAISVAHAKAMGIDYRDGQRAQVQTANGVANAYYVTLRSVSVGGIRVDNVQGAVVEGAFPDTGLLGMTYLRHVKLREEAGVLSFSRAR